MDELKYFDVDGIKYPYIYTLNVMNAIQNKYGTINDWADLIEPKNKKEPNVSAILFFFNQAINEGIDIENEKNNEKRPFINEKQVGRIITKLGIKQASENLKSAVVDSNKGTSEEKN